MWFSTWPKWDSSKCSITPWIDSRAFQWKSSIVMLRHHPISCAKSDSWDKSQGLCNIYITCICPKSALGNCSLWVISMVEESWYFSTLGASIGSCRIGSVPLGKCSSKPLVVESKRKEITFLSFSIFLYIPHSSPSSLVSKSPIRELSSFHKRRQGGWCWEGVTEGRSRCIVLSGRALTSDKPRGPSGLTGPSAIATSS